MELVSLAQLERTHRRHDEVIASLLGAARRLAAGRPEESDLAAVQEAVAYFQRAVTRQFLDEEGSVFPRLSTRRPELAANLAELSVEHTAQIELQSLIAAAADELTTDARPSAGMALLDVATRLGDLHRSHVSREDALFAEAATALTAQDDLDIQTEMETRRDREPTIPPPMREVEAKKTKAAVKTAKKPAPKKAAPKKAAPKKAAPKKAPKKKPAPVKKPAGKKPAPKKRATAKRR